MAASGQAIWVVLLAGSVLLSLDLVRGLTARVDPWSAMVASGLVGFAYLFLALAPM